MITSKGLNSTLNYSHEIIPHPLHIHLLQETKNWVGPWDKATSGIVFHYSLLPNSYASVGAPQLRTSLSSGVYILPSAVEEAICQHCLASFPGPTQLFAACMQCGKAGKAWYLFSGENDIIDKCPKIQNEKPKFNTRCV